MAGVPKLLLIVLGSATLAASLVMFILDGVEGLGYVWIYLKLLGVILLVSLFFSLRWLGARRWDRFIKRPPKV
jgi:hypothetical protein